jgi:hypothetical protein
MPEDPSPIVPLDADTAERLLSGRLDPDDAPPGYAEVARVLQAAAGPAEEAELADEEIAANQFHTARRRRPGGMGRGRAGLGRCGRRGRAWAPARERPTAPVPGRRPSPRPVNQRLPGTAAT